MKSYKREQEEAQGIAPNRHQPGNYGFYKDRTLAQEMYRRLQEALIARRQRSTQYQEESAPER